MSSIMRRFQGMERSAPDKPAGARPGATPNAGGSTFLSDLQNSGFGGKDITFWAGVMLMVNNITGPGIPQLPNLLVESGWLLPGPSCSPAPNRHCDMLVWRRLGFHSG